MSGCQVVIATKGCLSIVLSQADTANLKGHVSVAGTDIGRASDPLVSRLERVSLSLSTVTLALLCAVHGREISFACRVRLGGLFCTPLSLPTSPQSSLVCMYFLKRLNCRQ